ncbi:MAG: hypothetical protein JXB88_23025 [Spirochaetales bacterium]|nr:hypothetical protein [Spirochaetales bacterium]
MKDFLCAEDCNRRVQILSIGLSILFDNNQIIAGKVKTKKITDIVTMSVDLQVKNIVAWKNELKRIYADAKSNKLKYELLVSRDIYSINDKFNIGELLAYSFILQGYGKSLLDF